MTIAVIAEKPSVARSIADVLGANGKGEGCRQGNGYVVTWAIGHLVALCEPHELDPNWKSWRFERLPMLPREWGLRTLEQTKDHFAVVERIINAPEVEKVVCATDAGREGELIFRYIYRKAACAKPFQRLWISSLTADAIKKGFKDLKEGAAFDHLAAAAEARSRADWLVGMNFTRAYTLRFGGNELLSVGRVQTPTLAMLVDREKAIRDFVPQKYCEIEAIFGEGRDAYAAMWFDPAKAAGGGEENAQRLPADGALAKEIRERCEGKSGKVLSSEGTDKTLQPPLLYDLTELQRHANRLYGMTAQATLAAAQSLYEAHKLLSYPRTDSRHLSATVAASLGPIVASIAPAYGSAVAPGTGTTPLAKRFVDDSKVTDHHALIPTGTSRAGKKLNEDEEHVYDLVCRRLLMAWHDDHRTRVTKVITAVPAGAAPGVPVDHFRCSGTVVTQVGWKALEVEPRKGKKKDKEEGEGAEKRLPEGLAPGQVRPITRIEVGNKETSAPKRFNDATLLTAMESAGRTLDSRELEEAMRERGLGTPATRAAILETLLNRKYVERKGKSLVATEKGIALIDVVHEAVKSPQLTGEWELALKKLERGQGSLEELMAGIEKFVVEVIGNVRKSPFVRKVPQTQAPAPANPVKAARPAAKAAANPAVKPGAEKAKSKPSVGEQVRAALAAGEDALLVVPASGPEALAYQLGPFARGGALLVISPDVEQMEKELARLKAKGARADGIHASRSREDSRVVCRAWLDGGLDLLAVTPERLAVPGFPEMLAKRKPALVAVDEAHRVSPQGKAFSEEYRRVGGCLALLRPARVLALAPKVAAAVQEDLLAQLGLASARKFAIPGKKKAKAGAKDGEARAD